MNFKQIPANLLNKEFDPNNKYSLPYVYGLTGIGVMRMILTQAKLQVVADLWNPEFKGKVLLTSDAREVFHIALILDGKSPTPRMKRDIKAAYERLVKLLPNVVTLNSDSPEVPFVQGEASIGMLWNGSAYLAHKENPSIQFVYPKKARFSGWITTAIPKVAENTEGAYKFIDFLLRPENAKLVVEKMGSLCQMKA